MAEIDFNHDQGALHWCLTLADLGSHSGTCTPKQGETRYDLYLRIRGTVLQATDQADGLIPPTLFFDLQPNSLTRRRAWGTRMLTWLRRLCVWRPSMFTAAASPKS